ncbi:oxidoreductase [Rhodopseudomonas sp. WA056]|uniref:ferric reductase-like transmembrane domain-containing protein n=1 Tax=Rhodopseudomonas TaxID=1073 RepID=UPI00115E3EF9|nr:ferric reductase-like transmembrane domain-containing protein [Rhodopseudomonas palustris]NEW88915.1 oxidoreductase [Rhodopseudomonas sp. WA056]QDL96034.1 oxidoreductase [Rhodopseudomonas palustris]
MSTAGSASRRWSIPLLTLAVPVGFAVWAFPEGLAPLRVAGIVTGWLGCGLLLVSLLLMLREPRLAAWLGGLERMYRWHHVTGVAAYVLLLLHPLALAANNWSSSPKVAWQTLSPSTESWQVWSGWLGLLLLMVGLATTFVRHIRYGTWRWLHALLGLGVLIGLVHLILLGIDEPVVPILAVAGAILGWRLIRGDLGLGARPYLVTSARPLAERSVEIALRPLGEPAIVFPGQFVLVEFGDGRRYRGCGEFHPFTVSAIRAGNELHLAIKALGDCTSKMLAIEAGVAARVIGGFGGLIEPRDAGPQLWIAGGIGVTPFMAVLNAGPLLQPTRLLYLYRTEADAAFLPELRAAASAEPNLTLHCAATGDDLPDLDKLLPDASRLSGIECYLCGPPGLVAALKSVLAARGVAARHVHYENFEFR